MSNITTYYTAQETSDDIPYNKYFEFFSCENWSLQHYVQLIINNYANAEKSKAHHTFLVFCIILIKICIYHKKFGI